RGQATGGAVIGVNVTFQYEDSFDRARVIGVADNARATFEGMPGLRFKFFTLDESARLANNFYVWDSKEAALEFFSDELRQRVTDLSTTHPRLPCHGTGKRPGRRSARRPGGSRRCCGRPMTSGAPRWAPTGRSPRLRL